MKRADVRLTDRHLNSHLLFPYVWKPVLIERNGLLQTVFIPLRHPHRHQPASLLRDGSDSLSAGPY